MAKQCPGTRLNAAAAQEAADPQSLSEAWNSQIASQAIRSQWLGGGSGADAKIAATLVALADIGPRDALESMLAAQMIAAHNAAMECYRRATAPGQRLEPWKEQLNQAGKLSRTCARLLDALNKHRGKGQQKVTVEHVHVHAGGQAIVGAVEAKGGGGDDER